MANRLRGVKLHENLFSIIEIKSLFRPPIVRKRPIFYVIGKTPSGELSRLRGRVLLLLFSVGVKGKK